MALAGVALNIYGKIETFFNEIKLGQAPEKFSQQHLKDMGFASTNYRMFIPLLKELGFLTSDGTPTQRYHEYRNNALSEKVLGNAIKEAYSDIFVIRKSPKKEDEDLIEGKFKSAFNTSEANARKMMKTFFALLEIADISDSNEVEEKTIIKKAENTKTELNEKNINENNSQEKMTKITPSLNYNIQIHLPATKDVEVYNAIFKSIKEHLIE